MPVFIAPIVSWVAATVGAAALEAGATAMTAMFLANAAGFIAESLITMGALFGAQKLLGSFSKSPALINSSVQQLVKNSLAPRTLIYGKVQTSGVLGYIQQSGANNGDLYVLVMYCSNECDAIEQHNLNNFALTLDGAGNITGETDLNSGAVSANYNGKGAIWTLDSGGNPHFGSPNQLVDPLLQAAATAGVWPNTSKLSGICYTVIHLIYDQKVFGGGIPNPTAIIRGKKMIDPRTADFPTGTIAAGDNHLTVSSVFGVAIGKTVVGPGLPMNTKVTAIAGLVLTLSANSATAQATQVYMIGTPAYSNNSALCIMDYLLDQKFGLKAQPGDFDLATLTASLNNCDEAILLADASYEPRYTLNTVIDTTQTPNSILQAMLTSCAGSLTWAGGKWFLYSGYYRAPTVTLNENDFRDAPVIPTMPSRRDLVNSCKGMFVCPPQFWKPTDFPPYQNAGYIAQDQNEQLWLDLQLPCTTSAATAQRLAKIQVLRARTGVISVKLPCKLTALGVQCGDNIYLNYARMGWVNQMFEVVGFNFVIHQDSAGQPALGIDLELRGTAAAVWDWTAGSDTPMPVGPTTVLPSPFLVPPPTAVNVANSVQTTPDGIIVPALLVTWTLPTDAQVQNGGFIQWQYKNHASGTWLDWQDALGNTTSILLTDVVAGQAYDVRGRSINALGQTSAYVEVDNTTATGAGAAAGVPSSVVATAAQGKLIGVTWNLNTDSTIKYYKMYRSTDPSGVSPAFSFLEQVWSNQFKDTEVTLGTTYYYKVSTVNKSNIESALSAASNGAVATQGSLVNSAPPSTPSDPALSGSGSVYNANDGSLYSQQDFTVPGMPSGAYWQQFEVQKNGSSNWEMRAYLTNTGSTTITVPDLSPGVVYAYRTVAYNEDGVASTPSSTQTFTSAVKNTGPGVVTSVSLTAPTGGSLPPLLVGVAKLPYHGCLVSWTNPSDTDLDHLELKATATDTDGATDYRWGGAGSSISTPETIPTGAPSGKQSFAIYNALGTDHGYVRVRTVNRSGQASAWVRFGDAISNQSVPVGDIASQDANSVSLTGGTIAGTDADLPTLKIGNGSSRKKYEVFATINHVTAALSGGAAYEDVAIDISNLGFSRKPDAGDIKIIGVGTAGDDILYDVLYNFDNGSNSSTQAWVKFFRFDGANLSAHVFRVSGWFAQYNGGP